jgi:hypothetical protein
MIVPDIEPPSSYHTSAGVDLAIAAAWERRVEALVASAVMLGDTPQWPIPKGSDPMIRRLFEQANDALRAHCDVLKAAQVVAANELALAYGRSRVKRAVAELERKRREKTVFERSNRGPKPKPAEVVKLADRRPRPRAKGRFVAVALP